MINIKHLWKGCLFSLLLAVPAWYLGKTLPLIGGPVFGILLGMIIAFWKRPHTLDEGIKFTGKQVLQYAIILLGFEMNLFTVLAVGQASLLIILSTLTAAFTTAYFMGKLLKLDHNTTTLIGVGTAICGGSAIAATAPVIKAKDKEVAFSISTIFLFNILAVFIFPALGHFLNLSDTGFGMWAGTAINDTSSVVAAAYSYSQPAGDYATIVKLTRALMIIPITVFLAFFATRINKEETSYNVRKIFPWFILWFVVASIICTTNILPHYILATLTNLGKFSITLSMVAIGLNTNIKHLLQNGIRPIFLGLCCWFAVAIISLIIQHLTGLL